MNDKLDHEKILVIGTHILGWLLLFSYPFLMRMNIPVEVPWEMELKNGLYFLLLIIVFYVNYLILIPRLLFEKKIVHYLLSIAGLIVAVLLINYGLTVLLDVNQGFPQPAKPPQEMRGAMPDSLMKPFPMPDRASFDSLNIGRFPKRRLPLFGFFSGLSALFLILLGTSIRFGQQWFQNERQKEKIEREKLQTELSFLKSQINPHFFFNMLNNIYSLIQTNPSIAQKAVHKLSKLMRYVLYESANEYVTLEMEITFIKNYIELAKIRLPKDASITFQHSEENIDVFIPPLLFVPFLENVFKHGIQQKQSSNVVVSLTQSKGEIRFYTQNEIEKSSSVKDKQGIGLNNIKRRLELLYGDSYSLNINSKSQLFEVQLKIPANET